MRRGTSLDPAHGALHEVTAVRTVSTVAPTKMATTIITATLASTADAFITTAAPSDTSKAFPKWAIGVIVGFVLVIVFFVLSYHFNIFCFQFLRRLRRRRAHQRRYGNRTEIPLPSAEVLAAMGRGLRQDGQPQQNQESADSPYADPEVDVVLYKRAPLSEGGGHYWIPSFSRMYDRAHPENSRGLFVVLHELHGEVLLHESAEDGTLTTSEDEGNSDDDSFMFVSNASTVDDGTTPQQRQRNGRRRPHGRVTLPLSIPQAESASRTSASLAAAPTATWMTAGTPLRSYLTAHLTDPLYTSVFRPSRTPPVGAAAATASWTAVAGGGGGAGGGATSTADAAQDRPHHPPGPPPAEGVATVPNGYRAPTHMYFPLAQYCDLRQWHLVDWPAASLGAVQVRNPFTLAAAAAAAARRRGDAVSNDTESVEYDVPSDLLYGRAHYKKKVASAVPESRRSVSVESSSTSASASGSPHVRGNRFRANVSDDLSAFESTAE